MSEGSFVTPFAERFGLRVPRWKLLEYCEQKELRWSSTLRLPPRHGASTLEFRFSPYSCRVSGSEIPGLLLGARRSCLSIKTTSCIG